MKNVKLIDRHVNLVGILYHGFLPVPWLIHSERVSIHAPAQGATGYSTAGKVNGLFQSSAIGGWSISFNVSIIK